MKIHKTTERDFINKMALIGACIWTVGYFIGAAMGAWVAVKMFCS